jgi:hypothetical protein
VLTASIYKYSPFHLLARIDDYFKKYWCDGQLAATIAKTIRDMMNSFINSLYRHYYLVALTLKAFRDNASQSPFWQFMRLTVRGCI